MKFTNEYPEVIKWRNTVNFCGGAVAGVFATILSFPFDTIRTRLIAQSTRHKVYHGFIHSCLLILRQESPATFFKGLSPTILQILPHTALQFYFFGLFKSAYENFLQDLYNKNVASSMIAGASAGIAAKTIVYPFDLARKRLQIQGFERGRRGFGVFFHCNGLMNCFRATLKREGVNGLFKGLMPSLFKAAATTALHFTVYEQSLLLIKDLKGSSDLQEGR